MKTTAILTAAILATLGACASSNRDMSGSSYDSSSGSSSDSTSSGSTSSGSSTSGSTGNSSSGNKYGSTSGSSATDRAPSSSMPGASLSSGTSGQSSSSMASNNSSQNWSGVVVTIDPILRQDAAAMGVGVSGAAAAGGTMQSEGSPTDKVYRITMRADDGTTQTVVLDTMPSYKVGDRIRYRNGSVQRE